MTAPRTPDAASLASHRDGLFDHIGAFLAGAETARELDAWLLDATWNARLQSDPTTRSLAGRVGRYLTEYAKGHRTDAELRAALHDIVAEAPAR